MDHCGFVSAVDRLGESAVLGVSDATDRGLDAGLDQAFGGFARNVLHATVCVVDKTTPRIGCRA